MKRIPLVLAVALALPACGGSSPEPYPSEGGPLSSEELGQIELWKLEIMLEDRASNNATRQQGPSSWSTFFAPDGSVIRAGVGEIQGREAVHDSFMEQIYSDDLAQLSWTPERAEVARTGDLGYTVGQYLAVFASPVGDRTTERGKYVRIWARQPGGDWRVKLEIRNPVSDPRENTPS